MLCDANPPCLIEITIKIQGRIAFLNPAIFGRVTTALKRMVFKRVPLYNSYGRRVDAPQSLPLRDESTKKLGKRQAISLRGVG